MHECILIHLHICLSIDQDLYLPSPYLYLFIPSSLFGAQTRLLFSAANVILNQNNTASEKKSYEHHFHLVYLLLSDEILQNIFHSSDLKLITRGNGICLVSHIMTSIKAHISSLIILIMTVHLTMPPCRCPCC